MVQEEECLHFKHETLSSNPSPTKHLVLSQAQVVPATWKVEAGRSLESRSWKTAWAT
jgi:hypothetical protein